MVRLDLGGVFNSYSEAEEGLNPCLNKSGYEHIRKGEIVAFGESLVSVKAAEDVRNIHPSAASVNSAYVVKSRIGNTCVGKVAEHSEIGSHKGRLTHAVHRLYPSKPFLKIYLYISHIILLIYIFKEAFELFNGKCSHRCNVL